LDKSVAIIPDKLSDWNIEIIEELSFVECMNSDRCLPSRIASRQKYRLYIRNMLHLFLYSIHRRSPDLWSVLPIFTHWSRNIPAD